MNSSDLAQVKGATGHQLFIFIPGYVNQHTSSMLKHESELFFLFKWIVLPYIKTFLIYLTRYLLISIRIIFILGCCEYYYYYCYKHEHINILMIDHPCMQMQTMESGDLAACYGNVEKKP